MPTYVWGTIIFQDRTVMIRCYFLITFDPISPMLDLGTLQLISRECILGIGSSTALLPKFILVALVYEIKFAILCLMFIGILIVRIQNGSTFPSMTIDIESWFAIAQILLYLVNKSICGIFRTRNGLAFIGSYFIYTEFINLYILIIAILLAHLISRSL